MTLWRSTGSAVTGVPSSRCTHSPATSATTNGMTAVDTGRASRQRDTAAISAARPAR